jgi:hypothetical protein
MSNQAHIFADPTAVEAGRHFARLRHALDLVEQIAGLPPRNADQQLDEGVRVSGAYGFASPVAQRRFDTLAAEVSCWASTGVEALAAARDNAREPRAAAARLAEEIELSLGAMRRAIGL